MSLSLEEAMTLTARPPDQEEVPVKKELSYDEAMGLGEPKPPVEDDGIFSRSFRSFASGLGQFNAGVVRAIPSAPYTIAAAPQNIVARLTGWNIGAETPTWMLDNPITRYFEEGAKAQSYKAKKYAGENLTSLIGKGDYESAADYVIQSAIESSPTTIALAAASIAGIPTPALIAAGSIQGTQTFKEARDKQIGQLEATMAGVMNGSYEALFENMGTLGLIDKWGKRIVKDVGKKGAESIIYNTFKHALGPIMGEMNEEGWTQLTQDFTNKMYGIEDIPWKDFPGRALEAAAVAAITGTVTAGGAGLKALQLRNSNLDEVSQRRVDAIVETIQARKVQTDEKVLADAQVSQTSPEPTTPTLPANQGSSAMSEESLRIFPQAESSLPLSITQHPDFINLTNDAASIVKKYAEKEGVEPSNAFAKETFKKLHDKLGEIMLAPQEQRAEIARKIKEEFPDIQAEFSALRDKIWTDVGGEAYFKNVAGRYEHMRPKIGTKKPFELGKPTVVPPNENIPPEEEAMQLEELNKNTISEFRIGENDAEGLDIKNLIIEGKPRREVYDRAKALRDEANAPIEEARLVREQIISEIGKFTIDPGNVDIAEEIKSRVPKEFFAKKGEGRAFDEFAQGVAEKYLGPNASSSDVIDFLSSLSGKRRTINEFTAEAQKQIIDEMQGQLFERVQPGIKKAIREKTGQIQTPEEKTITERQALSRSLLRQAQAASQAEKYTKENIRKVKSEIQDSLKSLPVAERGKFASILASAETSQDVAKATVRILNHLNETIRKDLVAEISRKAGRAIDSDNVDIQYRDRIKKLIDNIQFKGKSEQTINDLKRTKEFIDREKAAGRDPQMPERVYQALKVLERKPIEDLNIKELINLQNKIELLDRLGRQRVINRKLAYDEEKNILSVELQKGTSPIQNKGLIQAKPGEKLSISDKFNNMITKAQNEALRIDLVLSPSDVVFDILDGNANYQGTNSRIIKQTLDTDFGNYLNQKEEWIIPVQELAAQNKMTDQNFERIAIHAYREQPKGVQYLLNEGLTKEEIDSVNLTEKELEVYNAMREQIEKPYQDALDILRDLYNRSMGKIDNYFPVQIDYEKVSDLEVFQRVGDMIDAGALGRRTKTVEQGSTKARRGTRKRIKLNAMDVFTRHMDDMAYFLEMQKDIKMLSEIVNSPEYQAAAGDAGGLWMAKWMNLMARKGGVDGYKKILALDALRKSFGSAMLGYKIQSILMQPTALFDGAAQVGGSYVSQGSQRVVTDKNWRIFLKDNFPEIRQRGADDPAYLELGNDKLMRGIRSAGYSALKKADLLTASAIAAGAYQKSLDQRGIELDLSNPDEMAIQEATAMVRRTQGSPFFKDVPQALLGGFSGNETFDKALFQFKSFMLTRWSQIRHQMWRAGIKEGNPKQAVEVAFWLSMSTLAETGIRIGSKSIIAALIGLVAGGLDDALDRADKTFDEETKGLTEKFVIEALNNIPFLGDLVNLGRYGGSPIPSFRPLVDFPVGISTAINGKKTNTKLRGIVQAIGAAASAAGIPGTFQVEQIVKDALKSKKSKSPF